MNQKIRFKYNNKIYQTKDLDKKLSQMGLTLNDIELIQDVTEVAEPIPLHYFFNTRNGHVLLSVSNLEEVKSDTVNLYNWNEWIEISKDQYDNYYKTGILH